MFAKVVKLKGKHIFR